METRATDDRLVELGAGAGAHGARSGVRRPHPWSGLDLGSDSVQSPQAMDFTPRARWTGLQHSLCRTYPLSLPRDDFQARISLLHQPAEELGRRGGKGTIMEHQSLMLGDRWAGCSQWCHSAGGHPWEAECFVQRKRSSSSGPFGAPDSRPAGGTPPTTHLCAPDSY